MFPFSRESRPPAGMALLTPKLHDHRTGHLQTITTAPVPLTPRPIRRRLGSREP